MKADKTVEPQTLSERPAAAAREIPSTTFQFLDPRAGRLALSLAMSNVTRRVGAAAYR